MATHGVPRRDFQALELRRQHAARLFAGRQKTQGAIARRLEVSRQSVMRWYGAWRASGRAGLKAAGRAGRQPRLAPRQLAAIETALRRGPVAAGFTTNLWTLPRVAVVIERVTGIRFHPGHVWRILGRLDWTLQRPAKQAKERNDTGDSALGRRPLARGKKNARRRRAGLVFQDESGVSQRPPRPAGVGAPRGDTPVLIHAFDGKKLSIAAALAFRWDGRRSQLVFQTCPPGAMTPFGSSPS